MYSCIAESNFGPYSTCGPCNDGDFDATECSDADRNACAGSSDTQMKFCLKSSAAASGVYGCHKYEDMTSFSTCGPCARRGLRWYDTPKATALEGAKKKESSSKVLYETIGTEAHCSTESCHDFARAEDSKDMDEPYCLALDFPCGTKAEMVSVCHYDRLWGYGELCIQERASDMLEYYPRDYCGPCMGGIQALMGGLYERIRRH